MKKIYKNLGQMIRFFISSDCIYLQILFFITVLSTDKHVPFTDFGVSFLIYKDSKSVEIVLHGFKLRLGFELTLKIPIWR